MRPRLLALLTALALPWAVLVPAEARPDDRGRPPVLQRALAVFADDAPARPDREATLLLRDLALRLPALSGRDREEAEALLARPTDSSQDFEGELGFRYDGPYDATCFTNVCVTYATTAADKEHQATAEQIQLTGEVVEDVWARTAALGYRPPLPDTKGPDTRLDVYLVNLQEQGFFGYCVPELEEGSTTAPGYCVLDNDYPEDFYDLPSEQALQVTAAHEFFHAVQFGYDAAEDLWLMEGTATWVEEQLYDAIDDNRRYFPISQLKQPQIPLDFARSDFIPYGSWIFFQYLTERYDDPGVVREIWERADAAAGAPDHYSAQAVKAVLRARGELLPEVYRAHGVANLAPRRFYEEGAAWPAAWPERTWRLTRDDPSTGDRVRRVHHLTNRTVRFRPGTSLTGTWKLRVRVDTPRAARGYAATLVLRETDGSMTERVVRLDETGLGRATVRFTEVRAVYLVLTNASTRYDCWQGTDLSCQGVPRDDAAPVAFRARAVRPAR